MAKHNDVFLYGQVLSAPKIIKNDDTGEYVRGICSLLVMHGFRSYGERDIKKLGYDKPIVISGNPHQVKMMDAWNPGDMIEIKGAVTTKNVKKVSTCKFCGKRNVRQGVITFVNPIYTKVVEKGLSQDDGIEMLKNSCEISNQVHIIGLLCRDPQCYITNKNKTYITNYQLAVSRKFHINEDAEDNRVDFPWIKAYGSVAKDDCKYLRCGSYVLVDGMLQSREIKRNQTCDSCGKDYVFSETVIDVVPYSTEYLRGFRTDEEIASAEAKERQDAIKSVFGENEIQQPTDIPEIPIDVGAQKK